MLWVTNRTNESFIDDVGFPECVVVSARSPDTRMCVTAYNTAETFTATTWQRHGEGWVDAQTNNGTGRKQFYEAVAGLLAACHLQNMQFSVSYGLGLGYSAIEMPHEKRDRPYIQRGEHDTLSKFVDKFSQKILQPSIVATFLDTVATETEAAFAALSFKSKDKMTATCVIVPDTIVLMHDAGPSVYDLTAGGKSLATNDKWSLMSWTANLLKGFAEDGVAYADIKRENISGSGESGEMEWLLIDCEDVTVYTDKEKPRYGCTHYANEKTIRRGPVAFANGAAGFVALVYELTTKFNWARSTPGELDEEHVGSLARPHGEAPELTEQFITLWNTHFQNVKLASGKETFREAAISFYKEARRMLTVNPHKRARFGFDDKTLVPVRKPVPIDRGSPFF